MSEALFQRKTLSGNSGRSPESEGSYHMFPNLCVCSSRGVYKLDEHDSMEIVICTIVVAVLFTKGLAPVASRL